MKIGKWSIIVPDKIIVKQYGEEATWGYVVEDNYFWENNVASNTKAIQYTGNDSDKEQVEFINGSYSTSFTGDIKKFADEWDKKHLLRIQNDWDNNTLNILIKPTDPEFKPDINQYRPETEKEKITRIGSRPTLYSSIDIY